MEREAGDTARLEVAVARERRADLRDRFRIAPLPLRGREKLSIASMLGLAKSTVGQWARRYRDAGLDALRAPHVNTGTMNVFPGVVSKELGTDDHAVIIMDGAGWHGGKKLIVPDTITILRPPPYSPELNPVERLWAILRSHYLSNRVYDDCQHPMRAGADARQQLTPAILKSVAARNYLTPEFER